MKAAERPWSGELVEMNALRVFRLMKRFMWEWMIFPFASRFVDWGMDLSCKKWVMRQLMPWAARAMDTLSMSMETRRWAGCGGRIAMFGMVGVAGLM